MNKSAHWPLANNREDHHFPVAMTEDRQERFHPGDPPSGVGPHEGRELELMLRGEKPLAFFSEPTRSSFELPDDLFEPHVQAGRIVKRDFVRHISIDGGSEDVRFLYYALPEEVWRIEAAIKLTVPDPWVDSAVEQVDRELGRLLGYTEDEIDTFLEWNRFLNERK